MGLLKQLGIDEGSFNKVTDKEIINKLTETYPNATKQQISDYYKSQSFGAAGNFWVKLKCVV